MNNSRKILVTGTAGFIGFHFAERELKKGNIVIGVDNLNNYYDKKIKTSDANFFKAIMTVIIADVSMSLDNVLGVAGAAKDHYFLLIFGLLLSIAIMAVGATLISGWIKKYRWIAWLGLIAILVVAIELIYTDIKLFI